MNQWRWLLKYLLLIVIFITIIVVRFAHYPQIFGFDYDQEINAFIAKTIVVDHKPTLIGPETSVGAMYVGPFFNYIIAAVFLLSQMDPSGTAWLNVLIVSFSVILVYHSARKIFSPRAGLLAMIFYGFSYEIAQYDWVLWNPTPIPLVSLGIFYFLWQYLKNQNRVSLLLSTALLGFMFHLHFSAFFLLTFFLGAFLIFKRGKLLEDKKLLLLNLIIFSFFLIPLIVFDLRHNFLNTSHFLAFIFPSGSSVTKQSAGPFVFTLPIHFARAIFFSAPKQFLDEVATVVFIVLALLTVVKRNLQEGLALKLYFLLFIIPIVFLFFYHGPIPSYYLFSFYLPTLVIAAGLTIKCINNVKYSILVILPIIFLFLFTNIASIWTFRAVINLEAKKSAVDYIISDSSDKPFRVTLVTDLGMNTGFKYLFWLRNKSEALQSSADQKRKEYKILIPYNHFETSKKLVKFAAIGVEKVDE